MTVFQKKSEMKSETPSITWLVFLPRNGGGLNSTKSILLSTRSDVRLARRTAGFEFTVFGIRTDAGASSSSLEMKKRRSGTINRERVSHVIDSNC